MIGGLASYIATVFGILEVNPRNSLSPTDSKLPVQYRSFVLILTCLVLHMPCGEHRHDTQIAVFGKQEKGSAACGVVSCALRLVTVENGTLLFYFRASDAAIVCDSGKVEVAQFKARHSAGMAAREPSTVVGIYLCRC